MSSSTPVTMSPEALSCVVPGTTPDPRIGDVIAQPRPDGKPFVSLEYFPPRTAEGVQNLHARMHRMRDTLQPAFTDMTWGAGGSTAELSLQLALYAHNTGHVANLHMTCTNLDGSSSTSTSSSSEHNGNASDDVAFADPRETLRRALQQAHDGGIRNLVALRGDPPAGQETWTATEGGFTCALDLVEFIRSLPDIGADFHLAVAGYPEGHPNAISEIADPTTLTAAEAARASVTEGKTYCCLDADYHKEMEYLKKKVDAGGDMIMTQMFFDAAVFLQFVEDCRAWGITVPIVPGLMCINAYAGFVKMAKFCKTRVPETLRARMEAIKDDAAAVKAFGVEFGVEMCRTLLASGHVSVLHFYTLNLEKVVYGVLDALGWSENALATVNESDETSMVAKGSAWARVGDVVHSLYGPAVVTELNDRDGAAKVEFSQWIMAGGQKPVAYLQKGQYHKVF
jgi:methylenetetrahydrofolate reductase (NADPH)